MIMKKCVLILSLLAALGMLQSCTTDTAEPKLGEHLILATWKDSALVDVTGLFQASDGTDLRMTLSKGSAQFLSGGRLDKAGTIDGEHCRFLTTKFNGREHLSPMYDLDMASRKSLSLIALTQDSILIGDNCDPDPALKNLCRTYRRIQ